MRLQFFSKQNFRLVTFVLALALFSSMGIMAQSQEQIEWEKQVAPNQLKNPAFAFVKDDPTLPRVLLIGDSISIGYTESTREFLKDKANLHRIPENGGDTSKGIQQLTKWFGKKKWDLIHFNWGLHDLKYTTDGKLDLSGTQVNSADKYESNLEQLVQRLKKTGAKLVWASTTPVPKGAQGRKPGDELVYNGVAKKVMNSHSVAINDLHSYVAPKLSEFQRPENVHFTPEGSTFLGKKVAATIVDLLED